MINIELEEFTLTYFTKDRQVVVFPMEIFINKRQIWKYLLNILLDRILKFSKIKRYNVKYEERNLSIHMDKYNKGFYYNKIKFICLIFSWFYAFYLELNEHISLSYQYFYGLVVL